MSTHAETTEIPYEDEPETGMPPRARRRLVTPVTTGLVAVLLAAAGFIGGVEVQKGQGSGGGAGATANAGAAGNVTFGAAGGGRAGGFGGGQGAAGGAGGAGNFTFGTVANKSGNTIYVTDSTGKTIRVQTTASSKITRTAANSVHGVYPGDTVVVQGATASNGTIKATTVRATSKTAAASGGFGGGGFGGGGGGAGGGAAAGGATGSGG
jgi:hypothetical protein